MIGSSIKRDERFEKMLKAAQATGWPSGYYGKSDLRHDANFVREFPQDKGFLWAVRRGGTHIFPCDTIEGLEWLQAYVRNPPEATLWFYVGVEALSGRVFVEEKSTYCLEEIGRELLPDSERMLPKFKKEMVWDERATAVYQDICTRGAEEGLLDDFLVKLKHLGLPEESYDRWRVHICPDGCAWSFYWWEECQKRGRGEWRRGMDGGLLYHSYARSWSIHT